MKQKIYKRKWFKIITGAVLAIAIILVFFYWQGRPSKNIIWGINFSPAYARYLGADPIVEFKDILTELSPKKVRLMAYWEEIEGERGKFDFRQTDALLKLAEEHNAKILMVVGRKQPHWPECHQPEWYMGLPEIEKETVLLNFIQAAVNHFKTFPAIERWQVENEPFFDYGKDCPITSSAFLKQEVDLVKSLDNRPVVITDSGEKGGWFQAAKFADVFGSTMYRKVHNPRYGGYVQYPLPPAFYRIRAGILRTFSHVDNIIGVELQAEPWFARDINDTPLTEQFALMNPELFKEYTDYARSAGFSENYFWGTEWWYWLKEKQNDSSMWEAAKKVLEE